MSMHPVPISVCRCRSTTWITRTATYFQSLFAKHDVSSADAATSAQLLRYPPTTGCPLVRQSRHATWTAGGGQRARCIPTRRCTTRSSLRSRAATPYMVLLVDLDTQRNQPSELEALRVVANLTTGDGAPGASSGGAWQRSASARVFGWCSRTLRHELSLPQWTIDEVRRRSRPEAVALSAGVGGRVQRKMVGAVGAVIWSGARLTRETIVEFPSDGPTITSCWRVVGRVIRRT